MKPTTLFVAMLMVFASCSGIAALEVVPFQTQNQSPFVQIFGLPAVEESSILAAGKMKFRFVLDHASSFVDAAGGDERLIIDGETSRFALAGKYGLGAGWECGITVPYLIAGGGFLDDFIESYHKTFNFPNGGRELAPKNRLLYQYRRSGMNQINVDRSNNGLGDVQFSAGYQLFKREGEAPAAVSLRAVLKAPTGDADELHGSGGTDASLWLTAERVFKFDSGDWTVFGAAGIMASSDGDVLPDQRRNAVAFGAAGLGWAPLKRLSLKVQVNGHTAFFRNTGLNELGDASAQLTAGGSIAFAKSAFLDIGLTEDIAVRTAPDAVFHFALRSVF